MAKRRTRKQKEKARHQFTISWKPAKSQSIQASKPEPKKASPGLAVKGQFKKSQKTSKSQKAKKEKPKKTVKSGDLASIRRDIVRSLFLASLILSLEVVIYFVWR